MDLILVRGEGGGGKGEGKVEGGEWMIVLVNEGVVGSWSLVLGLKVVRVGIGGGWMRWLWKNGAWLGLRVVVDGMVDGWVDGWMDGGWMDGWNRNRNGW